MSVILTDRLSCAFHAAIAKADWHQWYTWEEEAGRKDSALSLAKRAGSLSSTLQVPELLKGCPRLSLAYLSGLHAEHRPPTNKFFDVEKTNDRILITPRENIGDGYLSIKRGDLLPRVLGQNSSFSPESYKRFMHEEPPVSELRGLYYNDYDKNADFSLIYALSFNNDMAFGQVERKPFNGFRSEYAVSKESMLALIALNDIIKSALFPERSEAELDDIRQRANEITRRSNHHCFMPSNGICSSCKSDVTASLIDAPESYLISGCPRCGRTWCD